MPVIRLIEVWEVGRLGGGAEKGSDQGHRAGWGRINRVGNGRGFVSVPPRGNP